MTENDAEKRYPVHHTDHESQLFGGMGNTLTRAQKERLKRGETIYERDKQVDEYKYSKGKFV